MYLLSGNLVSICLDYSTDPMKDNQITLTLFSLAQHVTGCQVLFASCMASESVLTFSLHYPGISLIQALVKSSDYCRVSG